MFKKTILAVSVLTLAACASKPTTPTPTTELTAIGTDSSKSDSYENAFEQAEDFCKRWRAAPSVIQKQVKYNGQLTEGTSTAINTATDLAKTVGIWTPKINKDAYETTITYKCY